MENSNTQGKGARKQWTKPPASVLRKILARNVRNLMLTLDWSQPVLAEHAHVSQKSISNLLNAKTSIQLDVVQGVATAFHIDAWMLLLPEWREHGMTERDRRRLAVIASTYASADPAVRELLFLVAERERSRGNARP